MTPSSPRTPRSLLALAALALGAGCALPDALPAPGEHLDVTDGLERRAYIVSNESDELTVIGLDSMTVIGRVRTGGVANHMAEVSADRAKVYVTSSETNELVVVDAVKLAVVKRVPMGSHDTHMSLSPDGALLAVMIEGENAVSFVDTATDTEIERVPGFFTPHFMRFSDDGRFGYVANLGAHHITKVDLGTLEIDSNIALAGFEGEPVLAPDEGGFADAQIDATGMLYAAHRSTGRVLVFDTKREQALPEVKVGAGPWVVFAAHPFSGLPQRQLVPNFGDKTLSLLAGRSATPFTSLPGDEEAYGVNFSSRAPDRAFVMNRIREDIAVVDTKRGVLVDRLPVGGNTETAATTADGRFVVASVSSANRVVVVDVATEKVVKTFDGVGAYPWSVTIPGGQNYCH